MNQIPLPRLNDSTVGDMMRELIELREALTKANAIIVANSNADQRFTVSRLGSSAPEDAAALRKERDDARAALVEITQRYVDAEARAAAVPPEMAEQMGQAAREVIVKDTPREKPIRHARLEFVPGCEPRAPERWEDPPTATLTEDQIRSAIAKGKADRARLEAAGWQHGLLPKRPPYCHGQCVNAPEGEPPHQRTYNVVCAGCVAEMVQEQQAAIDGKVRADFALLMHRYEAFLRLSHTLTGEEKAKAEHDAQLLQAAADTADPAYWRGSDEGAVGTIRALVGVLDGPADAVPCFGSADLTALAKRLLAMRAELDAVHLDLGQAVAERTFTEGVLKAERVKVVDALWAAVGVPPEVPHGGKTLDEMLVYAKAAFATERAALIEVIDAVGKLAHAMGAEWSDADVPHAIEVLSRALRETERHRATQTELVQLETETAALERWQKGQGALIDGRIATAVLAFALESESRTWDAARAKYDPMFEAIRAAAIEGKAKLDGVAMEKALDEVRAIADNALRAR